MYIERHLVDEALSKEVFRGYRQNLQRFIDGARWNPSNLGTLIDHALMIADCGCVIEPESPDILRAIRLAAQACTALFAAATGGETVTVPLGDGEPVTYKSRPNESLVHVERWITGFYLSVLANDDNSLEILSRIPSNFLRGSTSKGSEYLYLYMDAVQAWWTRKPNVIDVIKAAVEATDPDRPDVADCWEWTLFLRVHQLEVLYNLMTGDPKFGEVLVKAVQEHKKYWSKGKTRKRDPDGIHLH